MYFTDPRLGNPSSQRPFRPRFHTNNFILTLCTGGLWLPVWIIRSYSSVNPHASRLP